MDPTLWIGLVLGVFVSLFKSCLTRHRNFKPLPLIGHLPYFAFASRQRLLEWIASGFEHSGGKSWRVDVPFVGKGWLIEDPSCLKHILSTRHDAFGKGDLATSRLEDLFGQGIILVSGPKWKAQRLAGHQAFTRPSTLSHFTTSILPKHLPVLLGPLSSASQPSSPGDANSSLVDIQETAHAYAMAVFGELAYDTDFSTASLGGRFVGAFDRAAVVSEGRFTNPLYKLTEKILPYGERFRRDVGDVKEFGRGLVKERRRRMEEEAEGRGQGKGEKGGEGNGTLLTELIKQFGREEDDAFLADACLNFLTAGRDTTAQALTWTIYLLLTHPTHLPTLLSELSSSPPNLSYTDLTSPTGPLPYTNAIISESLRLHPPVPLEIQENISKTDVALPDGSVVKPGEKVLWSPWQMGRSTRIWGPDAGEFKPERWLPVKTDSRPGAAKAGPKTKTKIQKHPSDFSAFENPVFHAGPRSCLGKNLAKAELAFALREILLAYELKPAWDTRRERSVAAGLTGPVQGGLPMFVTRRSNEKS